MRRTNRNTKWVAVIVSGLVIVLVALILFVVFTPRRPRATVAFNGYTVGADGQKQALFTITNTGRSMLRRWDFYDVIVPRDLQGTEHHLGPDVMLAPRQSEQVVIDVPARESAWKVEFHFTDYNAVEKTAYEHSGAGGLPPGISEILIDGGVDIGVSTDWIDPEE